MGFFFRESFWRVLLVRKFRAHPWRAPPCAARAALMPRHEEEEQEEPPQSTETPTVVDTAVLG